MIPVLSIRDPIHGFIRADALEAALIQSRPMQRLRHIRQLGVTYLVFPGAEHSRFSHVLGTMHLAGRLYDALASRGTAPLDPDPGCLARRLVRVAALLHDIGHAPYSHTAEGLFADDIDHEEMSRRLLATSELTAIFAEHGHGVDGAAVARVLGGSSHDTEGLLSQIVSGQLDVDKMDYLLRDSLYCGVRYGSYDLERLLDTLMPIRDPEDGAWRIGIDAGGIHALEAMVMARYYMFTQVYFNATGKVLEMHLNEWLREVGQYWPADPKAFLLEDDLTVLHAIRRSDNRHARALVERDRYTLAYETREHLSPADQQRYAALLPALRARFGADNLLVDHAAKSPHKLGKSRVLVRRIDGSLEPVEKASDFIAHLSPINSYRLYTPRDLRQEVAAAVRSSWEGNV